MKIKHNYLYGIFLLILLVVLSTGTTYSRYVSTFLLSTQASIQVEVPHDDRVEIANTGIFRPNVEIPSGKVMAFTNEEYKFLATSELLKPAIDIDSKLNGASLYIPASIGVLDVKGSAENGWNPEINWKASGHIIVESNINYDSYTPIEMKSINGNVIIDNITINPEKGPSKVIITAKSGNINANGAKIPIGSGSGQIKFEANQINIEGTHLSASSGSVNILSTTSINANGAKMILGSGGGQIKLLAQEINIEGADLRSTSNGGINIQSTAGNINAKNSNICTTGWSDTILTSAKNIDVQSARFGCSTKSTRFNGTGTGGRLWVAGASAVGPNIKADNLVIEGVLASGTISSTNNPSTSGLAEDSSENSPLDQGQEIEKEPVKDLDNEKLPEKELPEEGKTPQEEIVEEDEVLEESLPEEGIPKDDLFEEELLEVELIE